jgi:hypothetical protein
MSVPGHWICITLAYKVSECPWPLDLHNFSLSLSLSRILAAQFEILCEISMHSEVRNPIGLVVEVVPRDMQKNRKSNEKTTTDLGRLWNDPTTCCNIGLVP